MTREEANARLAQIKREFDQLNAEVIDICNAHNLTFAMRSSGKTFYATEHSFREAYGYENDSEWESTEYAEYFNFPMWVGSSDMC